jgi:hypothetical protein
VIAQQSAGLAPAWLPYILVDDVPGTLHRVDHAGGRVIIAPRTDYLGGNLAVIADSERRHRRHRQLAMNETSPRPRRRRVCRSADAQPTAPARPASVSMAIGYYQDDVWYGGGCLRGTTREHRRASRASDRHPTRRMGPPRVGKPDRAARRTAHARKHCFRHELEARRDRPAPRMSAGGGGRGGGGRR